MKIYLSHLSFNPCLDNPWECVRFLRTCNKSSSQHSGNPSECDPSGERCLYVEKTTKTNCVFNAIQVFWKVVKIRPNLEYGRQMKLDISRKVATSLKQRESSLISIFKSCFYERDATGTQTSQKIKSQKKSSVRRLFIFWNWLSVYQLALGSIVVHQCILSRHKIWWHKIITQQGRLS